MAHFTMSAVTITAVILHLSVLVQCQVPQQPPAPQLPPQQQMPQLPPQQPPPQLPPQQQMPQQSLPPQLPITQPGMPQEVCHRTLDLVFAIDGSNSLGQQNFNTMMETLGRAVRVLQFGPNQVRVGAVVFSTTTDVIELQTNQEAFLRRIQSLVYHDRGSNADQGIREATRILTANRRVGVPVALLLVTDGVLVNTNSQAAMQARQTAVNAGIDIWTVGVGSRVNDEELRTLASTPQQAYHIETFNRIPDQLVSLTRIVCQNAVVRPDLTAPITSPLEDLCRQSPIFEGIRYIPYPGDCTKVMQCYQNNAGRFLVITRRCPTGQFWNKFMFRCAPSWTVDCPYDKCKSCARNPGNDKNLAININGTATYPMSSGGPCGAYWECKGGRSYPRCCPPLFTYAPGCGCKLSGPCWDSCSINATCSDGIAPCYKYPDWTDPTRYFSVRRIGETPSPNMCPFAASYDVTRCRCTDREMDILKRRQTGVCNPVYRSQAPIACNQGQPPVRMQRQHARGPIALQLRMQLASPGFRVLVSSSGSDQFSLTVSGDGDGIHGILGTVNQNGVRGNTTTLFMDATGVLDVVLLYSDNVLSLSATQGGVTHVAQTEVAHAKTCHDCSLFVSTQGEPGCSVQQLGVYACDIALFNMYGGPMQRQ